MPIHGGVMRLKRGKAMQITNKYATYIAKQENAEIDNAVLTLNRIQCPSPKKSDTRITVRACIVAQK